MKQRTRFFSLSIFACATCVALMLGGCIGYRFGRSSELPFRSIYVAPPVNASLAPQTAPLLGSVIRRELDRSGEVRISRDEDADAVLEITLMDLQREISADRAEDTGLARKWRVTLSAECTLRDPDTGKVFFEKRVVPAFDEIYADSGQTAAEYQNMPVLMTRLGKAITQEILSTW
ncbi:MAG: LPS assembly lipoprotein LptE [Opitutaceae bacterium]